jgi:crotonobetainyl-CoA:carnitine CoA-transferase CaiB-like acyl-CoA transferase
VVFAVSARRRFEHPRLQRVPVQFDEQAPAMRRGPEHGEHTEEVLLELGYSWDDIAALGEAGVLP